MLTDASTLRERLDPAPLAGLDLATVAAATYSAWFERGVELYDAGSVLAVDVSDGQVVAVVSSARGVDGYVVALTSSGGTVTATCDCPVATRHRVLWCKHRVAVALACLGFDPEPWRYAPPAASAEPGLDFADGRSADDVPADWTVVVHTGAVRHVAKRRGSEVTTACGRVFAADQVSPGDENTRLCRVCARAR